ncbi:hypothetical protein [Sulfitobacter donghicola]|uniref:Uncharacterized protein n=1 Tax=Sulfitobacter donghicola DSW-25 = KCTC 12864 = JCM 14565 TaxID=1300350 RepID=A0A073IK59_9RHOB|nr:hypothetical protein [Sulfitobacter donghicola]KEJ89955.1 hypothetical protein DSW25_07015 [Sulfitobacter donghicola DSW-25 = KCTC 12864 = JCM 14565]KIN66916.1 hypothetical protein Z948_620 [Sulfitobacter donghicola DSW-25 = KCTC 12864 = JCM 14565]
MKKRNLSIGGFALALLLAGCGTPYEQCVRQVSKESRVLKSAIAESRLRISRGYAIHRQTVSYRVPSICHRHDHKMHRPAPYPCGRTEYTTIETPVPIDVAAERRKLASYQKQLVQAEAATKRGIRQCEAQYPKEG